MQYLFVYEVLRGDGSAQLSFMLDLYASIVRGFLLWLEEFYTDTVKCWKRLCESLGSNFHLKAHV